MATTEAVIERTERPAPARTEQEVRGTIGADDYTVLTALVCSCGYPNVDVFVAEAVSEKIKTLQAKVQAQFGPKKKR